jgi:hypothetical protein
MNELINKGFVVKKNIFSKTELSNLERNLIKFIVKYTNFNFKNISKKAKIILKYHNSKFRFAAIKLLEEIEKKDKNLFYSISKNCSQIISINNIDQNQKIQNILKKYFKKNYEFIQRKSPIMLFNKKKLERLKYQWHQESQFYPNHDIGLHMWFPVFRDVKSNNDGGMVFAVGGHKKNYDYKFLKKKDNWTQKIPIIDIEKKFLLYSPQLKRGDVIFFIDRQLHKSDDQLNSIPRVSFVFRYLSNLKNKSFKNIN